MMYYRLESDLIYTIIYGEKIERIFIEDPRDIEIGSILHARVKKVDKNRSFSFVEMGGFDGFYNNSDLKPGQDYLFNIRKKPQGEKGYLVDRNIKLSFNGVVAYPLSRHFYGNEMEDLAGFPIKSRRIDMALAEKFKKTWQDLTNQKSQLPIPKLVYRKESLSEGYILKNHLNKGDLGDLLKAFANTRELTGREVECENGSLIIDSQDHFSFVDFNSGDYSKSYTREINHLNLNLDLLAESLRILELRNIEGMILLDLLKMNNYQDFIRESKKLLGKTGFIFHDITALGLMELTRKKTGRIRLDEKIVGKMKDLLIKNI